MFASGKTATVVSNAISYIEDVFSTYLYTGNGSTQTITNGIDLSTKGGLVWQKDRSQGTGYHHILQDTARGATNCLFTNLTNAQSQDSAGTGFVFNNNGFTIGTSNVKVNASGDNYTSWTFRKQPKFFDVVTYTGNGTAGRTVAHSLGSVPGCMIVRPTSAVDDWFVYHRSLLNSQSLFLNLTAAASNTPSAWNSTTPTSTEFTVGTNTATNANGVSYVAYLFAHNAGGFGLTGTDNVISCGSFTTNASGVASVTLGYEPQWIFAKASSTTGGWLMYDSMRGLANGGVSNEWQELVANSSGAESAAGVPNGGPTATGFITGGFQSSQTYIYIAIRRGPMKVPTSGTSVFDTQTYTGTQVARTITTANTVDLSFTKSRSTTGTRWNWTDRLRGATKTIDSSLTASEADDTTGYTSFAVQKGYKLGAGDIYDVNTSGRTYVSWNFTRTPSFFDEICYTGTGSARTVAHNLSVVPEMMIVKARVPASGTFDWFVYTAAQGNGHFTRLNSSDAKTTGTQWNSTTPTASVFSIGATSDVNQSGGTYVAYLFATCAGVSKVGSYTGTGATQTIDCGFTSGARFVLIKKTNAPGDWYVWDSVRGISASNDPYLLLDTVDAEVTSTNYVDTDTTGFKIVTSNTAVNANSSTYIFLAIA